MKRKFILLAMMLLTLIGGVKFNVLNAQIDLTKQYRLKVNEGGYAGKYLHVNSFNAPNNQPQVGIAAKAENTNQIFTLEDAGNGNYYLKCATNDYYIKCAVGSQWWCVYAYSTTAKTPLYFHYTDGTNFYLRDYDKMMGIGGTDAGLTTNNYFKVENNGVYCDASPNYNSGSNYNANTSYVTTWSLEEVIFSVAVSADATEIWSDETVNLTAVATDGAGSYTYSWSPATGLDDATSATPVFTPTAAGTYTFTCTSTDANGATVTSEEISILVKDVKDKPKEVVIEVGSQQSTDSHLPTHVYYGNTFSQQIYTADDIALYSSSGETVVGQITKIAFHESTEIPVNRTIDIYMKNTSKTAFSSSTDWEPVSDENLVYSGNVSFVGKSSGWSEVVFTTPFEYEGGNILLCVNDKTNGYLNSYPYFYVWTPGGNNATEFRSMYVYRDGTNYDISTIAGVQAYQKYFVNYAKFTIDPSDPSPTIEVNYTSLDFGTVRAGGDFWTEKEIPSFDVEVTAKNTTIESVSIDDDFFTSDKDLATAAGQTEFNFTVSYNKEAEAGGKSGNIVVTYMNGEEEATVEIPMTATAYVPAEGDVVENPKAITFTEGAYTDNVTGVYDDYILPNEENDGNNGDAVYTFTLTEESLISANVDGTNGLVAIYRAADLEGNGPSSENSFAGNENNVPEVSMAPTTFFYDFEDGSLEDFNVREYDANNNHWQIIKDASTNATNTLISYSYYNNPYVGTADNYIYTKELYRITANSKLTMDAKCNGEYNGWDEVMVKVSKNGEEFTLIETVKPEAQSWVNNITVDLGAIFASKNIEYGDYHIALHHKKDDIYSIQVDNLKLTDGSKSRSLAQTRSTSPQIENVYPAGEYVLVAAAEGDFTLNITTGDIPAPEATTYVSPENNATEVADATLVFQLGKYTDEYQVLVGTSADALETVVEWTSELATTYTLADATNNTKYYWQVNTRNEAGTTTGEIYNFITPLDVPQNVTATATELYQDNNTTTISWTEIEGLTYNVYVDGVKQNEEAVTATEYVLSDLAWSPEGHSVTVTANHGELGESPMSEAVVVKVAGTFTITVNAVEDATVALSYSEGATDEFGNQLEDVYTNVTTDINGQAVFENVKLLGDWSAHYYEINVTKGLYNEEVYVINNVTITHDENYEVDVEMTLTTPNFNVSSETIHVGESVTLTWDAIEAENVTYNVYVNGTKHNAEAITAAEYVISDLAYNMNPGNAVAVTAVHSLGETPQDPIYVRVAGTFTLTVNVTDGTNPIGGANIVITTLNSTTDEFANAIEDVTGLTTDENGQLVVPNMKVMKNGEPGYMYQIIASKEFYNDGYENIVNYASFYGNPPANGDNVEKTITMQMVAPQNITSVKEYYFVGEDVVLTWEAPDFNTRAFLGYNVYQIENYGEDITKLNEEPLTETSYTITGLKYGSYSFGVSAVYDEGESSYPTKYVKVTGYGEISGTVKDDNNEPIKGVSITVEGYNEFYEEVTYAATTDASGAFLIENVMLSSYEGYTLTATKFDYQEKTVTGIEVVYDSPTQCNVTMQTLPGGTFAVTASEVGENVEVTWDVPTGGVAYNVYRRFDGDVTPLTTEEITTQSFTDETWSTLADGEYEYGVSAKIAQGLNITEDFEDGIPSTWAVYNARNNATSVYNWTTANNHDGISSYEGTYAAYAKSSTYGNDNLDYYYLVTDLIDLTGVVNPKLTFQYHTPGYNSGNTYCNTLKVKILTEENGQNSASPTVSHNWTNGKTNTNYWTQGLVDLSGYVGQKIYIAFENYPYYGDCSSIDYVQITSEATTYTTGVSWADPITKGGIEFLATADGNWNVGSNWSTGEVPSATDKVTIKGNAVITEDVNINTITIADGASLTLESGVLTAEIINNKNAEAFVIEDGAQLFQNNSDVAATFNMDVVNPAGEWSNSNQTGWQFVASPFTDATIASFLPSEGDYDLYKYDGTQDLEWVNHKYHGNSGGSFNYNFENGLIPSEIIQIDNDGDGKKWGVVGDYNNNYTYNQNIVGSVACLYSESFYATANTDNYLVLPKSFVVEGSVLSFQITNYFSYYSYGYSEQYQVLVSETTPEIAEFEPITDVLTTATSTNSSGVFVWEDKEYDLSAYNGKEIYIAIRHINNNDSGKSALVLDNIKLVRGEFDEFELEFEQGRAYLASYQTETVASLEGTLNNASSHTWNLTYNADKDLANFHLLGNPFTFDMDWSNMTLNNIYDGFAYVNEEGGYSYGKDNEDNIIKVGDGFFVLATAEEPSLSYGDTKRGDAKSESINLIATGDAGNDNLIISFDGAEDKGFNKLENFNKGIAEIYVANNGSRYAIMSYDENVAEIPVNFDAKQMGNYTINAIANGKFSSVILVDRFTGVETNLLLEDYNFTATGSDNHDRFIVKMVNGQQTSDDCHFAYVSGEDLVLNIEGAVQIIDVMGRVVYSNDVTSANNRINVSELNNAAYIIRVVNENGVKVQKIIL